MNNMKKSIFKIEHVNPHGEKMTLVLDSNYGLWFKHEDCNNEFENLSKLEGKHKGTLKYLLSKEEQIIFKSFMDASTNLLNQRLR